MSSTWRAVSDPTVRFRYNVTPMLVGNLLDLPFDGQSAITGRTGGAPARAYIGNREPLDPRDPTAYSVYAGTKPHFLALAPWVTADAPRAAARGDRRAAGTRAAATPRENDYLQTAVYADLAPGSAASPTQAVRPTQRPTGHTCRRPEQLRRTWLCCSLVLLVLTRRRRSWS